MEPSLLEVDDSSFVNLDVIDFPETWLQGDMFPDPQLDSEFHNGILNTSPPSYPESCPHALDPYYQRFTDTSYTSEDLLATNTWEGLSTIPSETNLSKSLYGKTLESSVTRNRLSEQPADDSCSAEPTKAMARPFRTPTTRKRRRLSEFTREKAKFVRRVGACLRCRVYKEPV